MGKVNFPRHQAAPTIKDSITKAQSWTLALGLALPSPHPTPDSLAKVQKKKLHFEKMEANETLLLFFFMRPMTLMLDAEFSPRRMWRNA